ncbi:MAG: hypothetical protein CMO01_21420 [Thalassobius sp.]|nr:hypothetical protein [Thalassovita sp.]
MSTLKQLLAYIIWIALALLLGIIHMWIVLGTNNASKEGLGYLYHMFYNWGLLYLGTIVGLIIAILFILFDVFHLKKKLKQCEKARAIRFTVLIVIAVVVSVIHYLLEKVIDVI